MAALWLALALASYALMLHGGRFGLWPRAPAVPPGAVRHRYFARVALRTTVHFGLVALVLLAAAGWVPALWSFPAELLPLRRAAIATLGQPSWEPVAIGGLGGVLLATWLERRGRRAGLGDIGAILPARRAELLWGVVLALEAGVTEELFFRLLLPLLLVQVGAPIWAAFLLATLLFGYAHRYQGRTGMIATTLAGMLLALVYLLSGRLWAAMLAHAAIDLNALLLRPWLGGRLR